MMQRILITGANGFFGRNLVQAWKDRYTITGIDYASGVNQTREPFDNWHRSVSHIDLTQDPAIREIDQQDVVVHLAARTRINPSWSEYRDYYQTNITASQMLFEQCQNRIDYCSPIYYVRRLHEPRETFFGHCQIYSSSRTR